MAEAKGRNMKIKIHPDLSVTIKDSNNQELYTVQKTAIEFEDDCWVDLDQRFEVNLFFTEGNFVARLFPYEDRKPNSIIDSDSIHARKVSTISNQERRDFILEQALIRDNSLKEEEG